MLIVDGLIKGCVVCRSFVCFIALCLCAYLFVGLFVCLCSYGGCAHVHIVCLCLHPLHIHVHNCIALLITYVSSSCVGVGEEDTQMPPWSPETMHRFAQQCKVAVREIQREAL